MMGGGKDPVTKIRDFPVSPRISFGIFRSFDGQWWRQHVFLEDQMAATKPFDRWRVDHSARNERAYH